MKTKNGFLFFSFVLVLVFTTLSCKKNSMGGRAFIVVYLKHNGVIIPNHPTYTDTVFVKYNAIAQPGNIREVYDTMFVGEQGKDHVNCFGLRQGNYFFYAFGMDTATSQKVAGGAAHEIKWSRRNAHQDLNVEVKP